MTIKIVTEFGDVIFYELPFRLAGPVREITVSNPSEMRASQVETERLEKFKAFCKEKASALGTRPSDQDWGKQNLKKFMIFDEPQPKVASGADLSKAGQTWAGLWLTDQGSFVEVVRNEECYFLRANGTRMVRGVVNRSGMVLVDGESSCSIVAKRRGGEELAENGKPWPTLKRA